MQNKIYARLLFYLFLIQSQLSPIQAQAVQHYTDRTTCHGSTGNHRVKQDTIQWEQNTCRHRNAYQICSDQTGSDEDGAGIHASNAKNLRVNKNDVNHRQEGGKTGDHFGPCRRAMFAQFKHAFQHPLARSLGCVLLTHYLFPNKEGKSVAIVYQNETIWTAEDNFFSLYLLIRQRLRHANWHDENVKLTIKERHVPDRSGIFRLRRYAGR